MHTLILNLPDAPATEAAGRALAPALKAGMVVTLSGDLGAGKTTLVRGVLRAMDIAWPIKSPTYTLVEPYTVSSLYLYHFDFYRLRDPEEWEAAGYREYFGNNSICLTKVGTGLAVVTATDLNCCPDYRVGPLVTANALSGWVKHA
jgi:tRNA threonylcarbamoyladenosine biosynthesis protein TsaE